MDEQAQLARAIRRAKLFVILPTALLMFLLAGLLIFAFQKTAPLPPDESLAPTQAAYYLRQAPLLCELDGAYYSLNGTADFASLFQTAQWTQADAFSLQDAPLTIRFADHYLLLLTADDRAAVYNGYVDKSHAATAYYTLPAGTSGTVFDYLIQRAEPTKSNAAAFSTVVDAS